MNKLKAWQRIIFFLVSVIVLTISSLFTGVYAYAIINHADSVIELNSSYENPHKNTEENKVLNKYDNLNNITEDKVTLNRTEILSGTDSLVNISTNSLADSTGPTILYASLVQGIGWMDFVPDGEISGTTGQNKHIEAIKVELKNAPYSGGIIYRTHVQDIGWMNPVSNGSISGTTGKNKQVEAIQINLTGEMAKHFDVYYSVHVEDYGWLGWTKNGLSAGTQGFAKQVEAIKIKLIKKGEEAPTSDVAPFILKKPPIVTYSTHVQDIGWMGFVSNGETGGTTGRNKQVEAIKIEIKNAPYSGGITYRTHVQDIGWMNPVSNGSISGTTGKNKQVEAIQINLTGEMATQYDIYYRVHVEKFGWLSWAKNGQFAGTQGFAKQIEAIQIVLVDKGSEAPGETSLPFHIKPTIIYESHVQDIGWMEPVSNGNISGTVGKNKQIEALKIYLKNNTISGGLNYSTHVEGIGWMDPVTENNISGTTGQNKQVEAVKINLTGEIEKYFDVYYRVHSQDFGWLDWAKNGQPAGTEGLAKQIEALQVVLVIKGNKAPGSTVKPYLKKPSVSYSSYVQGIGWQNPVEDGLISGTEGEARRIEAVRISLKDSPYKGDVIYNTHVQDYGWLSNVKNGQVSGKPGEAKQVEALTINLTGEIARHYDIYYRVHVQDYGWLGWAKNGMKAGTEGLAKQLEALEVKLVPKNKGVPVSESDAYIKSGLFITKKYYNLTFADALNMQMAVNPQTDIDPEAYVSKDYVTVFGSITGDGVNLRVSPSLSSSVAANVGNGTQFIVLDDNVTGDSFQNSTNWFKISYNNQTLYVHSKLAKIDYGIANENLNIREESNLSGYIFATVPKGTRLNILEMGDSWHKIKYDTPSWRKASPKETAYYLNPSNFVDDKKQRLQFLDILKPVNISEEVLNNYLKGKGVLEGKGRVFLEASRYGNGMNVVYLVAHALLETGNGTSALARGIKYKDTNVTVYNMYGIGARDSDPNGLGAKTAYEYGWTSVDKAIIGGAKWIYDNYLSNGQNTLYKMRWNPQGMESKRYAYHQYATDIGWAYKQIYNLSEIMEELYQLQPYEIYLEIPVYK